MLLLDWSGFRSLFGVIGVFLYHAPSSRWVVWSGGSKENWAIASRSSGPGSISIHGNDMSVSSLHPNSTLVVSSVGWDEKWSSVCCIIFIKVKLRGMSMFLTATRAKSHPVNSTIARENYIQLIQFWPLCSKAQNARVTWYWRNFKCRYLGKGFFFSKRQFPLPYFPNSHWFVHQAIG